MSTDLARDALRLGLVGEVLRVEVIEAVNWYWSRVAFDRAVSGGGVTFDTGPHAFDMIAHLLGPLSVVDYTDDSAGGVEATARLKLVCRSSAGDVPIDAWFTRVSATRSRLLVHGSAGTLSLSPHVNDAVEIVLKPSGVPFPVRAAHPAPSPFVRQLRNLAEAVRGEAELVVPGEQALAGQALIEECYKKRRRLIDTWTPETRVVVAAPLPRKVLLTGAGGNVGSRFVELWAVRGRLSALRCLVRGYRTAERILRFPVEIAEADLLSGNLDQAVAGCDAIVHLAAGEKPERETARLVQAARRQGVARLIHLSSACVYGLGIPQAVEALQEETPVRRTGELYADGKAAAEAVVRRASGLALSVAILRPHVVYGPGMRWSVNLMRLLLEGRIRIVEPDGLCNLIYVDDLVDAVERALVRTEAEGCYFISDGETRSWRDFIESHARLIGARVATLPVEELPLQRATLRKQATLTVESARAVFRTPEFRAFVTQAPLARATLFRAYLWLRDRPWARARLDRLKGGTAVPRLSQGAGWDLNFAQMQTTRARLSTERAEQALGFRAAVSFAEGLRRSVEWFRAHGVLAGLETCDG